MLIQWIKFCGIKTGKVKSEEGFTLLEVILVFVVMSILSSTLVMPFITSLNSGTKADLHATAAQLAAAEIEAMRENGFGAVVAGVVAGANITINDRTYTRSSDSTLVDSSLAADASGDYYWVETTVTETVSDPDVVVVLYAIISTDYD